MMSKDHTFMDQAVKLAWKGRHHVEPNPMVGAIFVKGEEVIAEGYHTKFGKNHAEIEAIKNAKQNNISLKGSTLYVTLEPCCHHGKRPPCTDSLTKLGLKKIIYAAKDPNPDVNENGIQILEKAGIQTKNLATPESDFLNDFYRVPLLKKRPFIQIKTASTLDGKITLQKGKGTPLTCEKSNKKVHELRSHHDAILIGINTLKTDNPRLTTRNVEGPSPIRIILDSNLQSLKEPYQIFDQPGETLIATTKTNGNLSCKPDKNGQVDLNDLIKKLYKKGIRSILVEGGETVNNAFLEANLVDHLTLIITPHLSQEKDLPKAPPIPSKNHTKRTGKDIWVESVSGEKLL